MDKLATFYTWSTIRYHDGESLKVLKAGSEVTQDKVKVDDETWKDWIEGGVVRKEKYPEGLDPSNPNALSPNAHRLSLLRREREGLEAEMAGVGGMNAPGGGDESTKEVNRAQGNQPSPANT